MEEGLRDKLIAMRDAEDTEAFVEKLVQVIEGSEDALLAYMLGRIDQRCMHYVSGTTPVLRRLVTDALLIPEVPRSADDYKTPEQLAEELHAKRHLDPIELPADA